MPTLYCYQSAFFKFGPVAANYLCNDFDPQGHENIGQAYESGVANSMQVNQFSEIFVHRDEDPVLRCCQFQQGPVTRIRAKGLSIKRIMPVIAKPICQTTSGTPIDKKPHPSDTETVASVSPAITAWA